MTLRALTTNAFIELCLHVQYIFVISERLNYLMLICTIMHSISAQSNTACSHFSGSVDYTDTPTG